MELASAMSNSTGGAIWLRVLFVALCAVSFFGITVHATDPDPLQDFCVADLSSDAPRVNEFPCIPRSTVTAEDFVYRCFREPGSDPSESLTGAVVVLAAAEEFPALNTQGITHARLDFAIGGVIALHSHPRAMETLFVLQGSIYTGFISDDNVLYASTLEVGGLTFFPKGMLHFQFNVSNETAFVFNALTSQNPRFLTTATQIFKPDIPSAVIETSFGIKATVVELLKASYPHSR